MKCTFFFLFTVQDPNEFGCKYLGLLTIFQMSNLQCFKDIKEIALLIDITRLCLIFSILKYFMGTVIYL